MPISGPLLKPQAVKFNTELNGDPNINPSDCWLSRRKTKHAIDQTIICVEAKSADVNAANAYQDELKTILKEGNYCEEQVYNCD